MTFLYLSRQDIRKTITMPKAIEIMHQAFQYLSQGKAEIPLRLNLSESNSQGAFLVMPVSAEDLGHFAVKTVSIFPANPDQNLPFIHAMILLFDGTDGQPKALMDGEWLTALRTGAASGLATQLLARPDASVAVIIGAGVQAQTQLEAIACVRSLEKVWVLNRNQKKAEAFAKKMSQKLEIPVRATASVDVLKQADIICTATAASDPLFKAEHLQPGVHINAVGAYRPDMREIPGSVVAKAKLVVDQREACLREAGDLLIPISQGLIKADHIYAEIGEVAANPNLGRSHRNEITLFKSVGNALQDLAVAVHAYHQAKQLNLGHQLPL